MVVLKETDFKQFLLWVDVVLKELIFNSLCIGNVWCSWKSWFLTVAHLGSCSWFFGLYIQMWWSWNNWFLTVSIFRKCMVVLKELILNSFYIAEGVVVLKELILNGLYIWGLDRVWWSWKNWFLTVCHLGCCGGLERTDFKQFLLWTDMVVLKELIFNSFYIWKYGGLDRSDFEQFLYWEGVVVLKELIFNSVLFGQMCVVLKELILNSFYFGQMWWSWRNWFLTVSIFLKEEQYGGLKRTDFEQFLYLEGMVVLTELILNSFYIGRVWWSWKNWF